MKVRASIITALLIAMAVAIGTDTPASASGGNAAPAGLVSALPDPKGPEGIGWLLLCVGAVFFIYNQGRTAISGNKPVQHAQPFSVRKEQAFVREEDLLQLRAEVCQGFVRVDREVGEIKASIALQMKRMEDYQHSMRHEIREEMQAIRSAGDDRKESLHEELAGMQKTNSDQIGRVHERCDTIVEKVGALVGQMELIVVECMGNKQKGRA